MRKVLGLIGLLENSRVRREVIRVALHGLGVGAHALHPSLHMGQKPSRITGELIPGVIATPRLAGTGHLRPQPRHVPRHPSTQTRQAINNRTHVSRIHPKFFSHRLVLTAAHPAPPSESSSRPSSGKIRRYLRLSDTECIRVLWQIVLRNRQWSERIHLR